MASQSVADNLTLPTAGGDPTAPLRDVALDDKYLATSGRVFLSGIQALVRLPIIQRQRDRDRKSVV